MTRSTSLFILNSLVDSACSSHLDANYTLAEIHSFFQQYCLFGSDSDFGSGLLFISILVPLGLSSNSSKSEFNLVCFKRDLIRRVKNTEQE